MRTVAGLLLAPTHLPALAEHTQLSPGHASIKLMGNVEFLVNVIREASIMDNKMGFTNVVEEKA